MDSDSPLVTAIISAGAVCTDCIASKAGLAVTQVDEVLIHIRNTVMVTSKVARCDNCLKTTVVHRLGQDAYQSPSLLPQG